MTKDKKDALMREISELLRNGHGEALMFYADRQMCLFKQGLAIGGIIGILLFCISEAAYNATKSKYEKT